MLRRIFLLALIVAAVIWSKPYWEDAADPIMPAQVSDTMDATRDFAGESFDNMNFDFSGLLERLASFFNSITDTEEEVQVASPELTAPEEQQFSIGNVEIGDSKSSVEDMYGEPQRVSENEYGLNWSAYHESYHNFMMFMYDEDETVRGLYTNQDMLSSQSGLAFGDSEGEVRGTLGEPEEIIQNGIFNFQIDDRGEYDVYQLGGNQTTFYYDKHNENTVTAVQIIDRTLESDRSTIYAEASDSLREGLEFQLFDLTNAARVKNDQHVLEWHEEVRGTARDHSADMAENEYFSHTNLDGQSPFDRMEEDDISFTAAGENLAAAQINSIQAHHGLMNSEGHRENILNSSFDELGVGVAFDNDDRPFFTEKFLSSFW